MISSRKFIIPLSVLLLLPLSMMLKPATSHAMTLQEYAVVINLAGKQRMLTQKMSKEALLILFGYEAADNQINLTDSYSLFEDTLKGLSDGDDILGLAGTDDEGILKQLDEVSGLWQTFRPVIVNIADSGTASDADISAIESQNLPLLKSMNKAVKSFEQSTQ